MNAVSMTAFWMAAERAREALRPDRLFDDPLAAVLAGTEGVDLMTRMEVDLPVNPTIPIRTRFFDDSIIRALADHQLGQVLLLGAGMDTRAYRLDLPIVFEVDLPALLEVKNARLAQVSAQPRCPLVGVGLDLTGRWTEHLVAAGFERESPSVFVAEGLLGYLAEADVHRFLSDVDGLAAAGSVLLADVSGRSSLDSPYLVSWYQRLADNGIAGARFGTDDPEGLLAAHGWRARVTEYGEEGANYGRWPYPPIPRDAIGVPHNFLIVAER